MISLLVGLMFFNQPIERVEKAKFVKIVSIKIQESEPPYYVVEFEFDKEIPNGTGYLKFADGTTAFFDEYAPKTGKRLPKTKILRVFTEFESGPPSAWPKARKFSTPVELHYKDVAP
jgi:hypothetical protein